MAGLTIMATSPISNLVYRVSRTAIDENAKSLVGIDRGCSLTKAAYVSKDGEGDSPTHYAVHFVLFSNSDFEGCLHFLKEHARLPATGKVRVTGTGCDKYQDVIERIMGLEVEFMDEFLTMFRGVHFLLSHIEDRESLFFPDPAVDPTVKVERTPEMEALWEERMKKFTESANADPDAIFPCIYVLFGSAVSSVVIDEDGGCKFSSVSLLGGKSLMGMGQALVGTSDYDELMKLAASGSCGNVDTTVEEFIRDDPKSPYGRFPKELSLFPFGKFVDQSGKLEDYKREDLAASIVHLTSMILTTMFFNTMIREKVSRVVIGGHGILGEPMREDISRFMKTYARVPFTPNYLKTGATGAIGAMIASKEDFAKIKPME